MQCAKTNQFYSFCNFIRTVIIIIIIITRATLR